MKMTQKELCVTGIGLLSPFGVGLESLWKGYQDWCEKKVVGPQLIERPSQRFERMEVGRLSKAALCVCVCAEQAIESSKLDLYESYNKARIGVSIGTAYASANEVKMFSKKIVDEGPESVEPVAFPNTVSNAAAGYLGALYGFKGLNITFSAGLLSSSIAISYACEAIEHNLIDIAIAGGVEELVNGQLDKHDLEGCFLMIIERRGDAAKRKANRFGYLSHRRSKNKNANIPRESVQITGGNRVKQFNQLSSFSERFHGSSTAMTYALGLAAGSSLEIQSAAWNDVNPNSLSKLCFAIHANKKVTV